MRVYSYLHFLLSICGLKYIFIKIFKEKVLKKFKILIYNIENDVYYQSIISIYTMCITYSNDKNPSKDDFSEDMF